MSSKSGNKQSNNKEEEKALKEAEIVAELAPDKETREEAEELIVTVESQSNTFAQDSSEIETYKQGVLKFTEAISKFQPKYAEAISRIQEEYIQLTKGFVDKVFAAQRNWVGGNVASTTRTTFPSWTYTPYAEQFKRQSDEITAQAMSVFETSNQLAINALNAATENLKLFGKAMESIREYNNNMANVWSAFLTPAQRQQYFRQ